MDFSLHLNVHACALYSLEAIWRDSAVCKSSACCSRLSLQHPWSSCEAELLWHHINENMETTRSSWRVFGTAAAVLGWLDGAVGSVGTLSRGRAKFNRAAARARRSAPAWAVAWPHQSSGLPKWNRHALATRHF